MIQYVYASATEINRDDTEQNRGRAINEIVAMLEDMQRDDESGAPIDRDKEDQQLKRMLELTQRLRDEYAAPHTRE